MSCECYMSRRVITSVILLVLFTLLLNGSLPKPQVLSTKEEEMSIASHAKATPDEAALVQKAIDVHRRAAEEAMEGSAEDPMGYLTADAKDFLKDNPRMVNALKKLKPTAKEARQMDQDQSELLEVVNNRGAEYAKPVLAKMQKHGQEKMMSVMKPSIAVAKAYKDLQTGLWDDTRQLTRDRFEHTTGVAMSDVDAVIEDMEMKQAEIVKARNAAEEASRIAQNQQKEARKKAKEAAAAANATKSEAAPVLAEKKTKKTPEEAPKKAEVMQLKESASVKKVAKQSASVKEESTHDDHDEDSGSIKLTASISLPLLLLAMVPHYAQ